MLVSYKEGSLVDVPGKVAVVFFTAGCNLRCPYCHNADLVLPDRIKELKPLDIGSVISRVKKLFSRGLIDAIAITGGEPLLWKDITSFLYELRRSVDVFIKMDTNGTFPGRLKFVVESGLVDYVAMDIKASPKKYAKAVGLPTFNVKLIEKSSNYLRQQSYVDYEFRTTVVPTIIERDDFEQILPLVEGAQLYALQKFRPLSTLDPSFSKLKPTSDQFLEEMAEYFRPFVKKIEIR